MEKILQRIRQVRMTVEESEGTFKYTCHLMKTPGALEHHYTIYLNLEEDMIQWVLKRTAFTGRPKKRRYKDSILEHSDEQTRENVCFRSGTEPLENPVKLLALLEELARIENGIKFPLGKIEQVGKKASKQEIGEVSLF